MWVATHRGCATISRQTGSRSGMFGGAFAHIFITRSYTLHRLSHSIGFHRVDGAMVGCGRGAPEDNFGRLDRTRVISL